MSLKPSTQKRIERILSRTEPYLTDGQQAALREIVEHELRGQDRDTRHACAEAVDSIDMSTFAFARVGVESFRLRAHNAVMNVQAV